MGPKTQKQDMSSWRHPVVLALGRPKNPDSTVKRKEVHLTKIDMHGRDGGTGHRSGQTGRYGVFFTI